MALSAITTTKFGGITNMIVNIWLNHAVMLHKEQSGTKQSGFFATEKIFDR
jgi:hypothetical protein